MDYLKFYELDAEPFRNDSDPSFFFQTRAQARARMRLLRGVQQRKGLMVLHGGAGLGKTTLARHLLESLEGPSCTVRMLSIPHASCDAGWVLPRIAAAFGVAQPASDALAVLGQVFERLAGITSAGRQPVLLIDEAQLLRNPEVMEEFRGLLNLEHGDARLLSMVLFGLPELGDVLRLDPPLAQRVDIGVKVTPLERDEVADYMRHRLEKVGGAPDIFSDAAMDAIYTFTTGIPRLINTLADNAMYEGALAECRPIDVSMITAAAEQLGIGPSESGDEGVGDDDDRAAVSGLAAAFGARAPIGADGSAGDQVAGDRVAMAKVELARIPASEAVGAEPLADPSAAGKRAARALEPDPAPRRQSETDFEITEPTLEPLTADLLPLEQEVEVEETPLPDAASHRAAPRASAPIDLPEAEPETEDPLLLDSEPELALELKERAAEETELPLELEEEDVAAVEVAPIVEDPDAVDAGPEVAAVRESNDDDSLDDLLDSLVEDPDAVNPDPLANGGETVMVEPISVEPEDDAGEELDALFDEIQLED